MNKFIVIACTIGIGVSIFLSMTIGLFEIPDAFFYHVLGQFLYTGNLYPVMPLNAALPQTLFGPMYGLFTYPLVMWGRLGGTQFLLPFAQLLLLGMSSLIVYFSGKKLFPSRWKYVTVILFLLLPFNLVYAFFFMSETFTMFLVSCAVGMFVLGKKYQWQSATLVLINSILVLTRYAFLPFLGLSVLYWIATRKKKILSLYSIPAIIGFVLIGWWIGFHMYYYHAPRLSTFTGRHLYDNVITSGKFIPVDVKKPQVSGFMSYVPKGADIIKPWWDIEPFFNDAFNQGKVTELDIDHIFFEYSIAGIREHLPLYVLHLGKMMIVTPNTPPYHDNVLTQIGFTEPECTTCWKKECRFNWMPQYCVPVSENQFMTHLFGVWIIGNTMMFPVISSLLLILCCVGIFFSFWKRNSMVLMLSFAFLSQHFFQSASEWVEGRFLIPLYPLYVLLIVYGIISIIHLRKELGKARD